MSTIPQPIKLFNPPGKLTVFKSLSYTDPVEGKQIIPLEIDWDGAGSSEHVNIGALSAQPFSQIIMLDVDNSQSGADVTFQFTDTGDTLVVPAYSAGTFPVFTQQTQFYASAPAALAVDVTRIRVLNYRQEPVANPAPQFHTVQGSSGIALVNGTTNVIPTTSTGTLIGYTISLGATGGSGGAAQISAEVIDHATSTIIDTLFVEVPANGNVNETLTFNDIAWRFSAGMDIKVIVTGTALAAGGLACSYKYRTP